MCLPTFSERVGDLASIQQRHFRQRRFSLVFRIEVRRRTNGCVYSWPSTIELEKRKLFKCYI